MRDIELRNVSLSFEGRNGKDSSTIYRDFNIKIEKGSFTVLLGPSGCGKSTFLNVINGLLSPTATDGILVDNVDIREQPEATRKMAYIFQGPRLLPWKSLLNNVLFGMNGLGVQEKSKRKDLAEKYFKMVGLEDYMEYYPHQVSGGMQQRAAIVRAWANEPEILLMDEPFSHLDEITGASLRRELIELWASETEKRTIVFVTHDITEAAELASNVVMLTRVPTEVCYRTDVDLPWPRDTTTEEFFELEKDLRSTFAQAAGIRY